MQGGTGLILSSTEKLFTLGVGGLVLSPTSKSLGPRSTPARASRGGSSEAGWQGWKASADGGEGESSCSAELPDR